MKKVILFFVLVVGFVPVFSQQVSGRITYEEIMSLGKEFNVDSNSKKSNASNSGLDAEITKQLMEQLKKPQQQQYELTFQNLMSKFEAVKKVENNIPTSGFSVKMSSGAMNGSTIKNIKEGWFIEQTEFFGKEFVIKDDLIKQEWIITDETKNIGEYLCIKATRMIPVSETAKAKYQEELEKFEAKGNALFRPIEPKDRNIVAWFTPQIPLGHGPSDYFGLPGLILEVHDGNLTYLASKIQLNPKDKIEIGLPNTKKAIKKDAFDAIKKEKFDAMKNENGFIIQTISSGN